MTSTGGSGWTLRRSPFTPSQIEAVARLHLELLPEGFLASLGERGLGLVYEHMASSRHGILLAAFEDGDDQALGFITATPDCGAFYRSFALRRLLPAVTVLAPRFLSPRGMRRALETLVYPTRSSVSRLPSAEIVSFTVSPSRQGSGLAAALFREVASELERRGHERLKVLTSEDQHRARGFYEKMGARKAGVIERYRGHRCYAYVYTTGSRSTSTRRV